MSVVIIPLQVEGSCAEYRRGEFQLVYGERIYARKFEYETHAQSPMLIDGLERGVVYDELIQVTVGDRCYVYGLARNFLIKVENHASLPFAIYIEGAMHVEYQDAHYLVNDGLPLSDITDLTTAELCSDEQLVLKTPMGRRMRMDCLDRAGSADKRCNVDAVRSLVEARRAEMRPYASRALELTRTALAAIYQLKCLDSEMAGRSFQDPHAKLIDAEHALFAIRDHAEMVERGS